MFPLYGGVQFNGNARYLLDQTRHWRPMVNGYSSFAPELLRSARRAAAILSRAGPIEELRSIRVSHVVLHRDAFAYEAGVDRLNSLRSYPDLEFLWQEDGVVVYRVRPQATDARAQ